MHFSLQRYVHLRAKNGIFHASSEKKAYALQQLRNTTKAMRQAELSQSRLSQRPSRRPDALWPNVVGNAGAQTGNGEA